jgi:hypothetical protein
MFAKNGLGTKYQEGDEQGEQQAVFQVQRLFY